MYSAIYHNNLVNEIYINLCKINFSFENFVGAVKRYQAKDIVCFPLK